MTDQRARPMFSLDGKVALVTGATSGIGRAVALAYADAGARVVGCGRDAAALESLRAELGERGTAVGCDVTSEMDVERAVATTVERFGRLDVAFNCAGTGGAPSSVRNADLKLAEEIWRTNVLGIVAAMKYESRAMTAGGGGSIINVSSVSATQPARGLSLYCSSKAAVDMLSKTAALELGERNIRVNALSPGTTETRMTSFTKLPGVEQLISDAVPLGRLGQVGDMVGMALLLASDAGGFITGQVLAVDGGLGLPAFPDFRKMAPREG
jgi:NAD(P)-dependent dehydrogenase (short-subunit alcohol dehydrogenase family)